MFKVRSVFSVILFVAACSATCVGQTSPATFHPQSYTVSVSANSTGALSLVAGDLTRTTFVPGRHNAFAVTAEGEPCNPPSSPSVNICAPANGSTVNSPVQVEASAAVTGVIAHTQLWVDGVKKFTETSTALETSIILPAGLHRFAIVATNTAGQKWKTAVYATVR
jgi:hypothetical protein